MTMRKWLIVMAMMSFLANGDVLTRDVTFEGRTNVRNKTGILKGWLQRDTLSPNRINVYDSKGQRKGYLQKDPLCPGKWQFRDR